MHAAIVLGGGRSARMGTDKLTLRRDGVSLLARTCQAAGQFAGRIVVAGHEQPGLEVEFVLEDPPFGGPVAGIAAGLAALDAAEPPAEVLLLAGDLANPEAAVGLLAAAEPGVDGVVLADGEGRPQYLAGRYRAESLRSALAGAGEARHLAVRRTLAGLDLALVPAPPSTTADIDTPAGASAWGFEAPTNEATGLG